jgi:plasmid stability protein
MLGDCLFVNRSCLDLLNGASVAINDSNAGEATLGALTIRNIDDSLKRELRKQAAANDRSMEEEARLALRHWVQGPLQNSTEGLGTRLRRRFMEAGRVELSVPDREYARPLPHLSKR